MILDDVRKTKNLIILDDSKSENNAHDNLLAAALQESAPRHAIVVKRAFVSNEWLSPTADQLEIDVPGIVKALSS